VVISRSLLLVGTHALMMVIVQENGGAARHSAVVPAKNLYDWTMRKMHHAS